jgi:hypothetical protein
LQPESQLNAFLQFTFPAHYDNGGKNLPDASLNMGIPGIRHTELAGRDNF